MTPSAALWIEGHWQAGSGAWLQSFNPADQTEIWSAHSASPAEVDEAFAAAREAFPTWQRTPLDERIALCRDFAELVKQHAEAFAQVISAETGKPLWEARTEVNAVAGKIELAISALHERRDTTEVEMPGSRAVVRYQPYGVMGVLGPFNLPAHLPNGHIVPSLLAGNTVVFKPSELTPAIGQFMAELWSQTKLPAGVLNLVQGGRETGAALVDHAELDGLLFTGSSGGGLHFLKHFAAHPEKMLALEMGGNAPLVVSRISDVAAAAYQTILSAYITAGQRCTCARRLLLVETPQAAEFLTRLQEMIGRIRVGLPNDQPEPFVGTLVSQAAADHVLHGQQQLLAAGGEPLIEVTRDSRSPTLLRPGLIDMTNVAPRPDEEIFGPLLQLIRVPDLEAAILEANRTRYGLAAGLFSDSAAEWHQFQTQIRAGIVNWNRQTTGASGRLPFGGIGLSGNHHPSGYFACDYCSYPMASLESEQLQLPEQTLPGLEETLPRG